MKASKFLTLILTLVTVMAIVSCVQDDDYTVPSSLGNEENKGLSKVMADLESGALTEISIASLKALFAGETTLIESDIVVKGYVSSSDVTGNFYKEFFIQDSPENPTAAIGVVLNQVDTYNQFNQGREVYIRLKDLYLGENSSDIISIGGQLDGSYLDDMTANQVSTHVFRSATTIELVPVTLKPSEVNASYLGMYVTLENVQIPLAYDGMAYHNPINDFETRYPLVSCENGSEILMETSSFASFKQEPLPTEARGSISGVISQGFGGSPRVLVLNTPDDVNFTEERCDPVFEESFNSAVDNTILNIPGWLNFAEAGTKLWTEQVFSGNGYAEFEAYGSGEASNIAWLITPGFDLDAQDGEILNFQTEHAYPDAGHFPLEVFISTNFDGTEGNILSATWEQLDVITSLDVDPNSWFTWVDSGDIDLSGYSGTGYIAFKYTGSDTMNQNARIHVENVTVTVP